MDIRAQITADILEAMEKDGLPPWRQGWSSGMLAFNASSGKVYQGINQLILGMQPHGDPRYLTYKQAEYMGLQVRRGERGVRVIKLVEVERKRARQAAGAEGEIVAEENGKALVLKAYTVFNAAQIDGMAPMPARECDVKPTEAVEAIVWGLQDTGLKLTFGPYQPAYDMRRDEIRIPVASDFYNQEDFNSCLVHEMAHSTANPKRIGRPFFSFGTKEYAREEIRAELASSFMGQGLIGLPPSQSMIESHASYISSWLEVLRNDKNEIFRAAADAQRICDYLSERALQAQPQEKVKEEASSEPSEPVPTLLAKASSLRF